MYSPMCVRVIAVASFYDITIEFWNCSDSVVYLVCFGTVPTVWYILFVLELFRQCGMSCLFWNCSDSVVYLVCFSFYFHIPILHNYRARVAQ
jgi:hypothetical protein